MAVAQKVSPVTAQRILEKTNCRRTGYSLYKTKISNHSEFAAKVPASSSWRNQIERWFADIKYRATPGTGEERLGTDFRKLWMACLRQPYSLHAPHGWSHFMTPLPKIDSHQG
jgi:hypothetical protein